MCLPAYRLATKIITGIFVATMADENRSLLPTSAGIESLEDTVRSALDRIRSEKRQRSARFVLAALSSIPWVGGFLSAAANFAYEREQGRVNDLQLQWLQEHRRKIQELAAAIGGVADRIDSLGPEAHARAESPTYLSLVRKGFGVWDRADTEEKRELIRRLLANAAGTSLAEDDLVRLFIDWVDTYHEAHFAVIRVLYRNPDSTRAEIWDEIYGREVRENSAEADLFKLLVRDLSTGSVLRQHRDTTPDGRFLRRQRPHVRREYASSVMKSAFDDKDQYELTELGKQFVHYVLNDIIPRLESTSGEKPSGAS
jgi:hypothetical protein